MNYTFSWLRQKIRKMSDNVYWGEFEHEKGFGVLYKPNQTSMKYIQCDQLTQEMKSYGEMPCLVYRKQLIDEHGQMEYDEFNVILFSRGKVVNGSIRIQENQLFDSPLTQWTYSNEDLHYVGKVEGEHQQELESFNQKWIQSILELPDIRLLAVTGLIRQKG